MKIFIDTSYFLPLIKIEIENIPQDLLLNLLSETSHEYFYSNPSIFEITAKGLKFSSQSEEITPQDIRIGIDTLQNDTRLSLVSYVDNPLIIELASLLRSIHNDTIDCLIFATAICTCECIITMDVSFFEKINDNPKIIKEIQEINDSFKFWFNDISNDCQTLNSKE